VLKNLCIKINRKWTSSARHFAIIKRKKQVGKNMKSGGIREDQGKSPFSS
jgi:hypothetical protein